MAVKDSIVCGSDDLHIVRKIITSKDQLESQIEKIILNFINNPPNIPQRQYIIARNQLLSLYRRMGYHPENIALCKFYENRIKQIIQLKKGKEK